MNYQQATEYHQAVKAYGSILGLENIRRLMCELGDVWKSLNVIHVAGTNGKGSVCCFLASVLKEAGYRVGCYNSPAVFSLREVYKINGEEIGEEEYAGYMEQVKRACEAVVEKGHPHPTVFEIETALAFCWFAGKKCDVVILETGMGGSTDATNMITHPLCSVFTSISRDHMRYLGNTVKEIAEVKSGIIKEGCPVVTTLQKEEAHRALKARADKFHAPYYVAAGGIKSQVRGGVRRFTYPGLGEVQLSMLGVYQVENASLAIEVIKVLRLHSGRPENRKIFNIQATDEQIKRGLKKAFWPGRFQRICKEPLFFIDGAHNPDGAEKLRETLIEVFPEKKKIGIMGVMEDKEYKTMLHMLLPLFCKIYTVTPSQSRALSGEKLAEEIINQGGNGVFAKTVEDAVSISRREADACREDTVIVAFGSLYYLNDVRLQFMVQ